MTAPDTLPDARTASRSYDAVVVGGGHNGLVAAAYLARAGRSVLVLERLGTTGGAAVSTRPFAGVDARLSRYSYLVSLLPEKIVRELGLRFAVRKRSISSYTPKGDGACSSAADPSAPAPPSPRSPAPTASTRPGRPSTTAPPAPPAASSPPSPSPSPPAPSSTPAWTTPRPGGSSSRTPSG